MHRLFNSVLRPKKSKQTLVSSESLPKGHPIPDDPQDAQAIYAFRSITTMLAHIHSPTVTTNSGERKHSSKDERRELRLLDALAAVAVREHEIVAAVAKGNAGSSIQVLVSANSVDPALNIPQHSNESWKGPVRWFITPNPRDRALRNNKTKPIDSLTRIRENTYMSVVDPSTDISQVFSTATQASTSSDLLNAFLLTEW